MTYSAARCTDFFEYAPGAKTCERAATWHHYAEVVQYRLAAGVLGLLSLAVYVLVHRRLRGDPPPYPGDSNSDDRHGHVRGRRPLPLGNIGQRSRPARGRGGQPLEREA